MEDLFLRFFTNRAGIEQQQISLLRSVDEFSPVRFAQHVEHA